MEVIRRKAENWKWQDSIVFLHYDFSLVLQLLSSCYTITSVAVPFVLFFVVYPDVIHRQRTKCRGGAQGEHLRQKQ